MVGDARTDDESSGQRIDGSTTRFGRRRLLRTGLNTGVAAALVWGVGAKYVSSGDLGTITYAHARPTPDAGPLEPRTKTVPVAWHENLRLAFGVQRQVYDAGLSPLIGSFVVPGSYDEPEASIAVDTTDEGIGDRLRELATDVAFQINVIDEIPSLTKGDTSISEAFQLVEPPEDDVPGGVACKGTEGFGTLTPALFDAGTEDRYFATSNHLYNDAGSKETEHRGEDLSILHRGEWYRIGSVDRGYPLADLVRVTPESDRSPVPSIERASPSRVIGQYTKYGLADLMARDEPLTKLGALSDRSDGPIKGVDGLTCYTGTVCKPGQLRWGEEDGIVDGDSGSVSFHPDPERPADHLLVGGMNNARTWWPGADFVWGTGAHHLFEEYGLHF